MKLASYQDGSRDGQLVVVSHDLATAHYASGLATRLQQLLDDWNFMSPQLEDLSTTLNHGRARHAFAFDPALCMAPLPRAYQRVQTVVDAATAAAHGGALLQQQRSGSALLGPRAGIASERCAAALAAITGDVPAGAGADAALEGVRLLLLLAEFDGGAAVFAPLAVTPDELGGAWRGGRAKLTLDVRCAGRKQKANEKANAAAVPWHFGELIAALAQPRGFAAGSIVGSGVVAEIDALLPGEQLRIETLGADGHSVFGAVDCTVGAAAAEPTSLR